MNEEALVQALTKALEGSKLLSENNIGVSHPDDGSTLVEIIVEHGRVGIALEPNPEDSGWWAVSDAVYGHSIGSGTLDTLDLKSLVKLVEEWVGEPVSTG